MKPDDHQREICVKYTQEKTCDNSVQAVEMSAHPTSSIPHEATSGAALRSPLKQKKVKLS